MFRRIETPDHGGRGQEEWPPAAAGAVLGRYPSGVGDRTGSETQLPSRLRVVSGGAFHDREDFYVLFRIKVFAIMVGAAAGRDGVWREGWVLLVV